MGKRRQRDPKKVSKAIGQHIRWLRHDRGWTLEETEEHGWTSWTHLQRVESGKNITIQTLVNVANLYGVSLCDLVGDI